MFLLFGGGPNGMAAALTSMLCMGAPLSSTLVAGIASLRLQKTAAAAGAVVLVLLFIKVISDMAG